MDNIFSCLSIVVVWLVGAVLAAKLADRKGLRGQTYFLLSLLLSPLVGLIAAAVSAPNEKVVEKSRLESGDERKCPYCAELVKREAIVCRFCGKDLPPPDPKPTQGIADHAAAEPRFKTKAEYDAWKAKADREGDPGK